MCPDVVATGTGTSPNPGDNVLVGGVVPPIPASPSEKKDVAKDVVE